MIPDVTTGKWQQSQVFGEALGGVLSLATEGKLVYAGNSSSVTAWDPTTWQQTDAAELGSSVSTIQILGENLFCLLGSNNNSGVAKLTLSPLTQVGICDNALAYALDAQSLYTVNGSKSIRVYDQKTLKQQSLYNTSLQYINQIACASGILAVIGGTEKTNFIGFYNSSNGVEQKVVSLDMNIPNLQTSLGGNFMVYDTFMMAAPLFQVWNSSTFQPQSTIALEKQNRPIAALLETIQDVFALSSSVVQLKNDCTLPVTDKFGDTPMFAITQVDPNTLITSFMQSSGICVWKKDTIEQISPFVRTTPPSWTMAQEIKLSGDVKALGLLGENVYTAAGTTIQRWTNNGQNQLSCQSTTTLQGQIVGMVSCAGQLFVTVNASANAASQLISLDPTSLQPGAAFTSDFVINCVTASSTKVYLGCATGIIYIIDPETLEGLKIGTNQQGISSIAVTPEVLEITSSSNGTISSFHPETGEAIQSGPTNYQYPMSIAAGGKYAITAEGTLVSNSPFGVQIFPLINPQNATLQPQTQLSSVEIPIYDALEFADQLILGGQGGSQRYTNDMDLSPLSTLDTGVAFKMLKLSEDVFLSGGDQSIRLFVRGDGVAIAKPNSLCSIQ